MILPLLIAGALAQNQTAAPTFSPSPTPLGVWEYVGYGITLEHSVRGDRMECTYRMVLGPCDDERTIVATVPLELANTTLVSSAWPAERTMRAWWTGAGEDRRTVDTFRFRTREETSRFNFTMVSTVLYEDHSVHGVAAWCGDTLVYTHRGREHQNRPSKAETIMQKHVLGGWSFGEGLGILFILTWVFLVFYYTYYYCLRPKARGIIDSQTELVGVEYSDANDLPEE
jgi:hypothetical protein